MGNAQEADFKPNYKKKCIVCKQKPTIDIHPTDGSRKQITELCGVCTWGDADALDPKNW